ncbi:PREDICTED: uncharacterized protein LOC101375707 [Odobenus rosmarus divergens]|uniref:Uncharacterized protein LOC101375707 n=1 Tax=Odobenus rosmarus divergens TaxID=9708 RepID=A0A9B0H6Q3_ODORO
MTGCPRLLPWNQPRIFGAETSGKKTAALELLQACRWRGRQLGSCHRGGRLPQSVRGLLCAAALALWVELLGSWYAVASGEKGFALEKASKNIEGVMVTLTPENNLKLLSSGTGTNFRDYAIVFTQLEFKDEAFNTVELYSKPDGAGRQEALRLFARWSKDLGFLSQQQAMRQPDPRRVLQWPRARMTRRKGAATLLCWEIDHGYWTNGVLLYASSTARLPPVPVGPDMLHFLRESFTYSPNISKNLQNTLRHEFQSKAISYQFSHPIWHHCQSESQLEIESHFSRKLSAAPDLGVEEISVGFVSGSLMARKRW